MQVFLNLKHYQICNNSYKVSPFVEKEELNLGLTYGRIYF